MAVSGWAMTLSQSCTTRGSLSVHRMFWDSQSPWPIHTRPGLEVSRSLTRRAASSIHSGPVTMLRSCPCSSRSGHSRSPGWSHPVHGGEGVRSGTLAGGGCGLDETSEECREWSRPFLGRQRAATRHPRLGRDRQIANPCRHCQRSRTWEPRAGQIGLNAQTAHDSRLEETSLDHHVQTAQQLDSDDLRNVPGAEEHALERHIQVTQTPVRKELIVEHTKQYRGSGNVLSCRR